MNESKQKSLKRWSHLRFSVIGSLLADPPEKGQLQTELKRLAEKWYRHPDKDEWITFGFSTIERWYYQALNANDPISALERKNRSDTGSLKVMNSRLLAALEQQYKDYPHWSYRLHADNLKALAAENPELGELPSYSTILRRMVGYGWVKQRPPRRKTKGQRQAMDRLDQREVRSFESSWNHALWHLDFHSGRRVVDAQGRWHTPKALCVLDDRSRMCCHLQWYLDETADSLIHGLIQAFHKRGLPRSLMTDNGAAMLATEVQNGLTRLGIHHEKTLPYSPYHYVAWKNMWRLTFKCL